MSKLWYELCELLSVSYIDTVVAILSDYDNGTDD